MWDRLLWGILLGYPVIYAIADDRSQYSERVDDLTANPLGVMGYAIQLGALGLAVGIVTARLIRASRRQESVNNILPLIVLFFGTVAAVWIAKGEFLAGLRSLTVCLVLAAIALSDVPFPRLLQFVRTFLRLQVGMSLVLGIAMPNWALVPPDHSARDYFGIQSRLIGLTAGPNYMGTTAAFLVILEFFLPQGSRWLRAIGVTAGMGSVLWSQSRTGMTVVFMTLLLSLSTPLARRHYKALSAAFVWGPIALMVVTPPLLLWLMQSHPSEVVQLTTGRVFAWMSAQDAVVDAPLFGVTSPEFSALLAKYTSEFFFVNAHNQLLEVLSTGGIVEAILFLVLLIAIARRVVRADNSNLTRIAVSLGVLGQLPFGTPFRVAGLSWNLVGIALTVASAVPFVLPWRLQADSKDSSPAVEVGSSQFMW